MAERRCCGCERKVWVAVVVEWRCASMPPPPPHSIAPHPLSPVPLPIHPLPPTNYPPPLSSSSSSLSASASFSRGSKKRTSGFYIIAHGRSSDCVTHCPLFLCVCFFPFPTIIYFHGHQSLCWSVWDGHFPSTQRVMLSLIAGSTNGPWCAVTWLLRGTTGE